ncbi:HNH endonuclease signature motif containing protein [Streptomyces cellulosae]
MEGTFKKGDSLPSLTERLLARSARQPNGCIHWTGTISPQGYGAVSVKGEIKSAHRIAYELLVGPIPDGAWIDHACHNGDQSCKGGETCLHRRCVNPAHLHPVTPRENQHLSHLTDASKTACVNGHPFTQENTYVRPNGSRACRTCTREKARARYRPKPRMPLDVCKNGHQMTEENTYLYGNRRICRECRREADRRSYWRDKS